MKQGNVGFNILYLPQMKRQALAVEPSWKMQSPYQAEGDRREEERKRRCQELSSGKRKLKVRGKPRKRGHQ